jgi:hypothetical protein
MIWTAITRVAAPYQQGSTAMNTQTIFRSDVVAGGVQQAWNALAFRVLHTTSIELNVICYWIIIVTLTTWSKVLLEKLTDSQLVKKFPAFMEPEGS